MKILFLCNKSPWPPREGGPMAMNMLIEGLADAGHQVKVIAVNSFKYNIAYDQIPELYRQKTQIELIHLDLRVKAVPAFLNLFTNKSYHVQRFISGAFRQRIKEILQEQEFDIIQLEMIFMAPYIATIRKYSRAKIILRAHNIEHLIWERIAGETANPVKRWYIGHLAKTLKKFELEAVHWFDGIVAITPGDAEFFREILGKGEGGREKGDRGTWTVGRGQWAVEEGRREKGEGGRGNVGRGTWDVDRGQWAVEEGRREKGEVGGVTGVPVIDIPFGVNVPVMEAHAPEEDDFPSLFSIGSMNWIPNQEGIRWFLDQVWPDIHAQFPRMKYYLAGREMPQWMKELERENVVVLGEVEDARSFMASRSVMIVPLFSGSGIRVKIIEGMAMGKTVISTAIGAEGIRCTNRENILIADTPCEFFEMVSICAGDRSLREKIGQKAKQLVATQYEPTALIKKLVAFYHSLVF